MTRHPDIASRIAAEPPVAVLTGSDDDWTLTLERSLTHPPGAVWAMLTDPREQARWSPIVTDRVLDGVGPASSRENPGDEPLRADVLVHEPPRELVHHWGDDVVRWTLTPTASGTRLELRHSFAARATASSMAAGWHVCLAALGAAADGVADAERVVGASATEYGWDDLRDAYERTWDGADTAADRATPSSRLTLSAPPLMRTTVIVRRPPADVWALITDPELTTQVWFTHSTGPLVADARVTWTWAMFDVSTSVHVLELVPDVRLVMTWGDAASPTRVEWVLDELDGARGTRVTVTESGFPGTGDEQVAAALDSCSGFTQVLVAAKAYLEHGVRVAVVADH